MLRAVYSEYFAEKAGICMKRKWKIVLAVVLLVYVCGSVAATQIVFSAEFHRVDAQTVSPWPLYADVAQDYPRRELRFSSGENLLTGWVYGEPGEALVVISHGLGATAETYLPQTMWFVDQGYCVFTYDATGTGASEGKTTVGLSQSVLDLDAALDCVENDRALSSLPVLLFGHSWGGYAAAEILAYDHTVTASVSLAGYASPLKMMCETAGSYCGPVVYLGAPFLLLHQWRLFGAAADGSAAEAVNACDTPILIVQGMADTTVRPDGAALSAQEITNPNAQRLLLEGEDHMSLLRPHTQTYTDYVAQLNREYVALYDACGGDVPQAVRAEFYAGVDKSITGGVWQELMQRVDAFYRAALA